MTPARAPGPRSRLAHRAGRWVGFLALLLVAACADEPAAPSPAAPPPAVPQGAIDSADRPAREIRPGVSLDRVLAVHDDEAAFLAGLRPPRSVRAEPVENEHVEGQVDTVRTRVYDGLSIAAYEVTGGPTFIQSVTVRGGYGTRSGVSPGQTRDALEAVLGPPVHEGGGAVIYETGSEPTPTTVEVVYESDAAGVLRASEITWRPYLD